MNETLDLGQIFSVSLICIKLWKDGAYYVGTVRSRSNVAKIINSEGTVIEQLTSTKNLFQETDFEQYGYLICLE